MATPKWDELAGRVGGASSNIRTPQLMDCALRGSPWPQLVIIRHPVLSLGL